MGIVLYEPLKCKLTFEGSRIQHSLQVSRKTDKNTLFWINSFSEGDTTKYCIEDR